MGNRVETAVAITATQNEVACGRSLGKSDRGGTEDDGAQDILFG